MKQHMQTQSILKEEKQQNAQTAYTEWKSIKDAQIKKTKRLFSYKVDPRQPPKNNKWCPARSIKYTYPTNETLPTERQTSNDLYSQTSFESDINSDNIANYSKEDKQSGTLKTVTVCCKKIEFLCICKQKQQL